MGTFVSDTAGPLESALTFLAVVLIVVQHEAAVAPTSVASEGVDALVLAASLLFGALVDICSIVSRRRRDESKSAAWLQTTLNLHSSIGLHILSVSFP